MRASKRHSITEETFAAVHEAMKKYPTMTQKEISALLTGSGIPVAPSTVSRLFRAKTFDDYIDITRAGYSTKPRKNAEPVTTLCDMAEDGFVTGGTVTNVGTVFVEGEMPDEFYEGIEGIREGVIEDVNKQETEALKPIADRLDIIIANQDRADERMQTIAILLNALLNEWRGMTTTIDETIKEVTK